MPLGAGMPRVPGPQLLYKSAMAAPMHNMMAAPCPCCGILAEIIMAAAAYQQAVVLNGVLQQRSQCIYLLLFIHGPSDGCVAISHSLQQVL